MATITSVELGASGRYISLGNPTVLNDLGPVTVLMYCRPTAAGGGSRAYGLAKNSSGNAIRMLIDDNSANPRLAGGFNSVSSTAWPEKLGASNGVPYNSWYHLAMVSTVVVGASNEPASKIDLYVNGSISTPSGSNNGVGNVTSDAANAMFLMNREGLGREFIGDVAYWAIYSGALTSTQLASAATYGPMTTTDSVYSQLICCIANGVVYNGPMDPSNTVSIVGRSTRVTGTLPPNTNLDATGGDTTAPVLTSATGSQTGSTTGTGGATTDEANGTFYSVASTSSTAPSAAQVKAGQMHTGSAAAAAANTAVSSTGAKSVNFTGLSPSTTYYAHSMHEDAAANQSNVVTSSSFTTTAGGGGSTAVAKITQLLRA